MISKMGVNRVLYRVRSVRDDSAAMLVEARKGFPDGYPWDVNDVGNWEAFVKFLDEAIEMVEGFDADLH